MLGEQAIDLMLEKAEVELAKVLAEFNISHILAAFSGGDDSIVATHWIMSRFPDAAVMTANTEIGLQATREHQRKVVERFDLCVGDTRPDYSTVHRSHHIG